VNLPGTISAYFWQKKGTTRQIVARNRESDGPIRAQRIAPEVGDGRG
jgi:hypothetical protein